MSVKTMIQALRVLASEIQSEDGVANACISDAADLIEKQEADWLKENALVMANARRLIKRNKSTSNGRLFSELFGTGQGTARNWCRKLGLDPDSNVTNYDEMLKQQQQAQGGE